MDNNKAWIAPINMILLVVSCLIIIAGAAMKEKKVQNANLTSLGVMTFQPTNCWTDYDEDFGRTYWCTYTVPYEGYSFNKPVDESFYNNWQRGSIPSALEQSVWEDDSGFHYYEAPGASAADVHTMEHAVSGQISGTGKGLIGFGIFFLIFNIAIIVANRIKAEKNEE